MNTQCTSAQADQAAERAGSLPSRPARLAGEGRAYLPATGGEGQAARQDHQAKNAQERTDQGIGPRNRAIVDAFDQWSFQAYSIRSYRNAQGHHMTIPVDR